MPTHNCAHDGRHAVLRAVSQARPTASADARRGEPLFEFLCGHDRMRCELRDHGDYGVEAQFFQNEEFLRSRRFETRALAVQWAEEERKAIECGL